MQDIDLYEKIIMYDSEFPVKFIHSAQPDIEKNAILFNTHWHEHIELWYLFKGRATITYNGVRKCLGPDSLGIANSNELHEGYSDSNGLEYYCIIIDPDFFSSDIGKGHFVFENLIDRDEYIKKMFSDIFREYQAQKVGYDLAIKSYIYSLLVYLMRNYTCRHILDEEYVTHANKLERISPALKYIEDNFNSNISYTDLAKLLNVSEYYFCHLFKEATGKTVVQYINEIRINKAYYLLKNTDMNITQIAMAVGFSDMNYFSRIFKKHMRIAPSVIRNREKRAL